MIRTKPSRNFAFYEQERPAPTPTSRPSPNRGTCGKSAQKSDQPKTALEPTNNLDPESLTKIIRDAVRDAFAEVIREMLREMIRSVLLEAQKSFMDALLDKSPASESGPTPSADAGKKTAALPKAADHKKVPPLITPPKDVSEHWIVKLKARKGVPELAQRMIESICKANHWKSIPKDVCAAPFRDAYAAIKFLMDESDMTVKEIRDALDFWCSEEFEEQRRFVMVDRPIQFKSKMARIVAAMKKSSKARNLYEHLNPNMVKSLAKMTGRSEECPQLLSVANEIQTYYRQSEVWKYARKGTESYDRITQIYGPNESVMVGWYGEWLKYQSWVKDPDRLPLAFFRPTSKSFRQWINENANDWGCGAL